MKRFLILLSFFLALLTASIFLIAIPKAEKNVTAYLTRLGFKDVVIQQPRPTLTGLKIPHIQLDSDGFNTIENTQINIFWPTYFLQPKIKNIIIDEVNIAAVPSDLKNAITKLGRKDYILDNLVQNIILRKITYDVALSQKALRFEGRFLLEEKEDGSYALRGALDGVQHEIAFQSVWSGKINLQNQALILDGTFENIKVKLNSFDLNRGQGWLSYISTQTENNLGMQINAGSGKVFKIPLQNLNMTLGQDDTGYPILFRSNIIGLEEAKFTADFLYALKTSDRQFSSQLYIPDQSRFLDVLKLNRVIDETPQFDSPPLKSINTTVDYIAEKRFAGGPLPFDITLNDKTSGTILIYPDSLDVRGNITGDQTTIDYLEKLIKIPEEMMTENTIRIDENLKKALQF